MFCGNSWPLLEKLNLYLTTFLTFPLVPFPPLHLRRYIIYDWKKRCFFFLSPCSLFSPTFFSFPPTSTSNTILLHTMLHRKTKKTQLYYKTYWTGELRRSPKHDDDNVSSPPHEHDNMLWNERRRRNCYVVRIPTWLLTLFDWGWRWWWWWYWRMRMHTTSISILQSYVYTIYITFLLFLYINNIIVMECFQSFPSTISTWIWKRHRRLHCQGISATQTVVAVFLLYPWSCRVAVVSTVVVVGRINIYVNISLIRNLYNPFLLKKAVSCNNPNQQNQTRAKSKSRNSVWKISQKQKESC